MAFFRGIPNKVIVNGYRHNDRSDEYLERIKEETQKHKLSAKESKEEITLLNEEISLLNKQIKDAHLKLDDVNRAVDIQESILEQVTQNYIIQTDKAKHDLDGLKREIVEAEAARDSVIAETAKMAREAAELTAYHKEEAANLSSKHYAAVEAFTADLRVHEKNLTAIKHEIAQAYQRLTNVRIETKENQKLLDEINESIKQAELIIISRKTELTELDQRAESIKTMIDENNSLREFIENDKLANTNRAKELAIWHNELKVESELIKTKNAALIKREQTVREAMERFSK